MRSDIQKLNESFGLRNQIHQLQSKIASVMQRDRHELRRLLRKANQWADSSTEITAADAQQLESLAKRIQQSNDLYEARKARLPTPNYDTDLPIYPRRKEIADAIRNNQVVVVSGQTGSGKSTQLPMIAIEAGLGVSGFIGHTQPRRIAARSVASRIAQQLQSTVGADVGFKIRFDDKTGDRTYIKLMTDGILLAETQSDRFLDQYELIIIDEAHERSLNIDFLLGYVRQILPKRPDLRVVITSATIDTKRFAQHFSEDDKHPVPIIDVEGRSYPVNIVYRDPAQYSVDQPADINEVVVAAVQEMTLTEDGDILVFLPTENDIRIVSRKLKGAKLPGRQTETLPLYARLTTQQQNLIFQPSARRRIVLATNVAESSITVPGIRTVIDTGVARISRYVPRSKVQRLPIEAVSQASANQRAGRCGRVAPGVCVRLYSEEDFLGRPKFTTPEIRRTNLASVILQTLALRLGDISDFPFIDPPHSESIRDGYKTLYEIGAIDDHRRLTQLGRWLSRLPVDPRIGRMIFAADQEDCLAEILIIASALEIQDPRVRPAERQSAADQRHEKLKDEKSDYMSYLKLWDFFHELKAKLSRSQFNLACQQNFLSVSLLRQWQEIHRQLYSMVRQNGLKIKHRKDDYNAIHRSLLAGLLSGIAMLGDQYEYTGAGGIKFHLWPGSGVFANRPKWIVVGEIVETSRRFGRTAARIAPEWIEPLAVHLVKRKYVDPHWSRKRQSVMAYENVTLFGLPIVLRRRLRYGTIDPQTARDLFIESCLVENDELSQKPDFFVHNQLLLESIRDHAAKTRRRDWIVETDRVAGFYQERLPDGCFDAASLNRALQSDSMLNERLKMTRSDLLPVSEFEITEDLFPDEVIVGSLELPVEYCFHPGKDDDGATVKIPAQGIGQIDDVQAPWLVPGLNEARIAALIKSLPKRLRRNFVPAPDTARRVSAALKLGQGSFLDAVANALSTLSDEPITPDHFDLEKVDSHLWVNLQVVDDDGKILACARNVRQLRQQLGDEYKPSVIELNDQRWNQDGLLDWTWDDFPEEVMIERGKTRLTAYPVIVDQGQHVGIRLLDSKAAADRQNRLGLVRLFRILNRRNVRTQVNWLPGLQHHAVKLSRWVNPGELNDLLGDLIVRIAMVEGQAIPRSQMEFQRLLSRGVQSIPLATQEVASWLASFAIAAQKTALALEGMPEKFLTAQRDIRSQLNQLISDGFMVNTPWKWLQHFPRYFDAIAYRIEKLSAASLPKDLELTEEVDRFWQQYVSQKSAHEQQSFYDSELEHFRWMIEEYRVSLFAQPLGTSQTVSVKRLEKQFSKVTRF